MGLQPGTGWPMYFLMLARCFWMILRNAQQAQRVSAGLWIEREPSCYCSTAAQVSRILQIIASSHHTVCETCTASATLQPLNHLNNALM